VQSAALILRIECPDRQQAQRWWEMAVEACRGQGCRVALRYVRVEAKKTVFEGQLTSTQGAGRRKARRM
jgi:hypothetical protein